jgi:hypothetical protein
MRNHHLQRITMRVVMIMKMTKWHVITRVERTTRMTPLEDLADLHLASQAH